ncbi:ejaculatory bulb-specific protein 3-like [Lycorma delicatula]|uniref:ejaculatory bulb-specific protein 3-like n=1 Tax=Lycorma delicatula TaxID=130591 RepID=UPI003F514E78
MMKFVLIASFLVIAVSAKPADKKYTTKYDNIDLDEILNNDRLFNNYYQCLMETGKCTPDGTELKDSLPDALATKCSKCSDKQKVGTEKVIKFLIEKKPEKYAQLEKKYDPQGKYKAAYKEEASKRGIKI